MAPKQATNTNDDHTATQKSVSGNLAFSLKARQPGLLIAHSPPHAASVDRLVLPKKLTVGRRPDCDYTILDSKISGRHFVLRQQDGICTLEDLGSTNGSFVDGTRVRERVTFSDTTVIRCGNTVFIYQPDIGPCLKPAPPEQYGFAGKFHTGAILDALREASISAYHTLLSGPSGTGKELAAHAFAGMCAQEEGVRKKFFVYNAAKFASREEATSTLFGVAPRFFSNVDARPGLIEQADGGTLFLDELHNLPSSAQRTLLRIMEDGEVSRLGETTTRRVNVRFVIASNADGPTKGLAGDLFSRLRLIEIPPLGSRIADVPSIFDAVLTSALTKAGIAPAPVIALLKGDHYESLCLEDYTLSSVRALRDLADRLVTRIATQGHLETAVSEVFGEKFRDGALARRLKSEATGTESSRYRQNKALIVATFHECDKNVAATVRALKNKGLRCSRRWLTIFLEDWGEKT